MRAIALTLLLVSSLSAQVTPQTQALPLSIKSEQIRESLDRVWVVNFDQEQDSEGDELLREILRQDPNFAMGHEILARASLDPAERVREQGLAWKTRIYASIPEQTVIEWLQNAADHKLIPAVVKMNKILSQYPRDRWVVWLAIEWLNGQKEYDHAAAIYERSGISHSPGLINTVAYTYANMRRFDRALALMDEYARLLPHEPAPQDSYGDILRMAGQYRRAIEHYRAALAIDPKYDSSQFGIADTFLVMGEEDRARQEYEAGLRRFHSLPADDRIAALSHEAVTYVYERNPRGADKAFQAAADYVHSIGFSYKEADIYRQMALYQQSPKKAQTLLDKAEEALGSGTNSSISSLQQKHAQIQQVRVEWTLKIGGSKAAEPVLAQLAGLARNSDDNVVNSAYNGAAGASLFSAAKFKQAIPNLEEDADNPLSLKLLTIAYQKTGDSFNAKRTAHTLASLNAVTVERALVVPAIREHLKNSHIKRPSR